MLAALAAACAGAFLGTFLLSVHSARGLHFDLTLYRHVSGNTQPVVRAAGIRGLRTIDISSLAVSSIAIALLAAIRGRFARAVAALGVIGCSVGSAELIAHGLPHVAGALTAGRAPTFPSGHSAVAASVGFALVLAVPRMWRPTAALVGAAYAAGIGLALVVVGAHEASDVVGSLFICTFWACVFALTLCGQARRPELSVAGVAFAVCAVAIALLAAAALAYRHPAAVAAARSAHAVIATAALFGIVSLVLFGGVTMLVGDERTLATRGRQAPRLA